MEIKKFESHSSDKLTKDIHSSMEEADSSFGIEDFAIAVAQVIKDEFGSHNHKPFIDKLTSELSMGRTYEEYEGNDNSITKDEALSINKTLVKSRETIDSIKDESKFSKLEDDCKKRLEVYDKVLSDFIITSIFYDDVADLSNKIIEIGDLILSKEGTDPIMVSNAVEDCYSIITKPTDKES